MPVVIPGRMKTVDRRVAKAIAIMDRERANPMPVSELARAVNLSPSYLTRLFRANVGCAPADFDRQRRLDCARELVTTSFLSIKQVMACTGWSDPSHFSRDFRQRFGVSPSALRKAATAERREMDQDAYSPTKTRIRQQSKRSRRPRPK